MSTNRIVSFFVTAAAGGAPLPGLALTFNYIRRVNADDTETDLTASFPVGTIVDKGAGRYEFAISGALLPAGSKILYVIACGGTAAAPFLQGEEDADADTTVAGSTPATPPAALGSGTVFSQSDLDTLKAAVASGVLSVSYNGPPARTITYQSLDSMRKLLADMVAAAGNAAGTRTAYRFAATRKGV